MAIINLTLKDEVRSGKWGKVSARDGSIAEYKITLAELASISANGIPIGLTKAQWETGNYSVSGNNFYVGDIEKEPDGSVTFKYHEQVVAGKIVEHMAKFAVDKWTGIFPNISILPIHLLPYSGLISIDNGIASVDTTLVI